MLKCRFLVTNLRCLDNSHAICSVVKGTSVKNIKSGGSRLFLFYLLEPFWYFSTLPRGLTKTDVTPFQERWRWVQNAATASRPAVTSWVEMCPTCQISSQLRTEAAITGKIRDRTPESVPGFCPALISCGGQQNFWKVGRSPSLQWRRTRSSPSRLSAAHPSLNLYRHPIWYSNATPALPLGSIAYQVVCTLPLPHPPLCLPAPPLPPSQHLSSPVLTLWDGSCVQSPDPAVSADYPCRFLCLSSPLTPQPDLLLTLNILRIPNPLSDHSNAATQTPRPFSLLWQPRTMWWPLKCFVLCISSRSPFRMRVMTSSEKLKAVVRWKCPKYHHQFQKKHWQHDEKLRWLFSPNKALKPMKTIFILVL